MDVLSDDGSIELFGANVRRVRESLGWSQTDLARKMQGNGWPKYSQVAVSRTEEGTRTARLDEAFALAKVLERPFEQFLVQPEVSKWVSLLLRRGSELEAVEVNLVEAVQERLRIAPRIRELMENKPSEAALESLTGWQRTALRAGLPKIERNLERDILDIVQAAMEQSEGTERKHGRKWSFDKAEDASSPDSVSDRVPDSDPSDQETGSKPADGSKSGFIVKGSAPVKGRIVYGSPKTGRIVKSSSRKRGSADVD